MTALLFPGLLSPEIYLLSGTQGCKSRHKGGELDGVQEEEGDLYKVRTGRAGWLESSFQGRSCKRPHPTSSPLVTRVAFLSPGPTSVGHSMLNPVPLPSTSLSSHLLQDWLALTKRKCVWFCLVSFPVSVAFQREIIVRNVAVSLLFCFPF